VSSSSSSSFALSLFPLLLLHALPFTSLIQEFGARQSLPFLAIVIASVSLVASRCDTHLRCILSSSKRAAGRLVFHNLWSLSSSLVLFSTLLSHLGLH
jgi:hypothetical protein